MLGNSKQNTAYNKRANFMLTILWNTYILDSLAWLAWMEYESIYAGWTETSVWYSSSGISMEDDSA